MTRLLGRGQEVLRGRAHLLKKLLPQAVFRPEAGLLLLAGELGYGLQAVDLLQLHGLLTPLSVPPLLLGGGVPGGDRPHPAPPPGEDHEEDPVPSIYRSIYRRGP
jgi:hypothetical protein